MWVKNKKKIRGRSFGTQGKLDEGLHFVVVVVGGGGGLRLKQASKECGI